MYQIIFSENSEKDFVKLPKKAKKKVFRKIKTLQDSPTSGKQLLGKLKGLRSLRAWPFRIIYQMVRSKKNYILVIIHRQRAYK